MRPSTKNRRGRPRQYDPETVLDAALALFRRQGFSATSLDQLAEATGLNRPSLYAGFGHKEQLYLLALERFRQRLSDRLAGELEPHGNADSPVAALGRYFKALIDAYVEESLGCAVFGTAVAEAPERDAIRSALQSVLSEGEKHLMRYLEGAQNRGWLPADYDPLAAASLLSAVQHSLALRARAGQSRATLEALVCAALTLLFPSPQSSRP